MMMTTMIMVIIIFIIIIMTIGVRRLDWRQCTRRHSSVSRSLWDKCLSRFQQRSPLSNHVQTPTTRCCLSTPRWVVPQCVCPRYHRLVHWRRTVRVSAVSQKTNELLSWFELSLYCSRHHLIGASLKMLWMNFHEIFGSLCLGARTTDKSSGWTGYHFALLLHMYVN